MPTTTNPLAADLPRPGDDATRTAQVPCLDSRALFGEGKSVLIEHEGKVYELRVTRLGKLILTA